MMQISIFYPSAGLLALVVVFGIWVSRVGKPYNGVLFNLHKLTALGGVILTGVRLFQLDPLGTFPALVLVLLGLAALGVIALFATGAVMSIQAEVRLVMQSVHGISLVIAAGALLGSLLMLYRMF